MENNYTYRTNQTNFNQFVSQASNKEINKWVILSRNIIFNKSRNIKVIKDNRIKGKAYLGIPARS